MRETPYPLAAARTQRDQLRRDALAELGTARQQLHAADAALDTVRATVEALRRRRAIAPPVRDGRTHAAAEIAREGAYATRLQRELAGLLLQLKAAEKHASEQRRAVRLAELRVADAHAQREVLERHHAQFRATERKASERAQELEDEELRSRPPGALRS
jgi:hypothetical protein